MQVLSYQQVLIFVSFFSLFLMVLLRLVELLLTLNVLDHHNVKVTPLGRALVTPMLLQQLFPLLVLVRRHPILLFLSPRMEQSLHPKFPVGSPSIINGVFHLILLADILVIDMASFS